MKLRWRKLSAGEPDLEFGLGVLFLPALGLTVGLILRFVPEPCLPRCLFHTVTGLPCPACGSYRAVRLLLAGRWAQAWKTQPLTTAAAFLATLYAGYAWGTLLFHTRRLRIEGWAPRHTAWAALAALAAVLANWAYLLSRS